MKKLQLSLITIFLLKRLVTAACPYETIQDDLNNQCYQFPFQCGSQYYLAHPNGGKCLQQCPNGYTQDVDSNLQKICKFSSCSFPDVFYFIKGFYCLKTQEEKSNIDGYQIIDKDNYIVYLPDCPTGFTSSSNSNGLTCTTSDANFSWTSKNEFLQCTGIRDLVNLTCLTNKSQCNDYYNDYLKTCSKSCSVGYNANVDSQINQNICSLLSQDFSVSSCTGNQFIEFPWDNSLYCSQDDKSIRYLSKDANSISVNLPYCPTGFTEGVDVGRGVKTCVPPQNFSWNGHEILKCKQQFVSFTDLKCLTNPKDCSEYLDFSSKKCVKECPSDKSPITDNNGNKYCRDSLEINFRDCPFPNIPYIAPYSRCLTKDQKDQCDQVLVEDSIGHYLCIPDCPTGFTDTSTGTQKSCKSPNNFIWSYSQIISARYNGWNNYVSLISDLGEKPCQDYYNIEDLKLCFKNCPPSFTIGTDTIVGYKYCVPPENYEKISNDIGELGFFYSSFNDYPDGGEADTEQNCKDFIIKDESGNTLCWPTCPKGYTSSTDQVSGQKKCNPPAGSNLKDLKIWTCDPIKVKDGTDLGCLNSIMDCKTNFDYRNYACLPSCLNNSEPCYNEKLGINVCKYNKNCSPPQAFDFLSRKCVPDYSNCGDQYLLSDEGEYKLCIPECPSSLTKVYDSTLKLNKCLYPSGKLYQSSELGLCKGPKIRDFSSGLCLNSVSDCKGYYIKQQNACFTQCPKGYTTSTDSLGVKICVLSGSGTGSGTGSGGTGSGTGSGTNDGTNNNSQTSGHLIKRFSAFLIFILLIVN